MKKIITLALAAFLAVGTLGMVSCSSEDTPVEETNTPAEETNTPVEETNTPTEEEKEEEIVYPTRDEIVIYTNAEFAPFEYILNNEIVGVDIDICNRIAEKMGAKATYQNVSFDSIIMSINSNKGDIGASGFTITDERKEMVNFSIPYYNTTQYMVIPKGSTIKSINDLAGKVVAVQIGTTGDFAVTEMNLEGTEIIRLENAYAGAVAIGDKYDAVVIDELTAKNIADINDFDTILIEGLETEQYGLAFNKNDPEILEVANDVIAEMIADGSLVESLSYHVEASKAAE